MASPAEGEKRAVEKRDFVLATLEAATGLASTRNNERFAVLGRLVQAARRGDFVGQFRTEYEELRDKGKIKEEFPESEQGKSSLYEMLSFLDQGEPSKITFDLMKNLFFAAASEQSIDPESVLPQQYLQICRKLSAGEVLLLEGCYRRAKEEEFRNNSSVIDFRSWAMEVAKRSGLKHVALVEVHAESLAAKGLVYGRMHADRSGIFMGDGFGMTSLGLDVVKMSRSAPSTAAQSVSEKT